MMPLQGMSNELILNAEKAAPGTTPAIKIPVVTPIKPPPVILETPLTTTPASNASVMDQTTFKPKQDRPHNSNSAVFYFTGVPFPFGLAFLFFLWMMKYLQKLLLFVDIILSAQRLFSMSHFGVCPLLPS